MKLLSAIVAITAFHSAGMACLPPPQIYQGYEIIQAVVKSEAMYKTLSEVFGKSFEVNISSVSLSPENQNEVKVTFTNKCEATMKVIWENTDPSIPCGGGYRPTKVERKDLTCE